MKLVESKGYLRKVFTQNIDTLERRAGVSESKVIEAHGSFAKNHCIDCRKEMQVEELKRQMYKLDKKKSDEDGNTPSIGSIPLRLKNGQKVGIPKCECGGLVKPDIVFFGEGLPDEFFEGYEEDIPEADLVIVAGTSLTVSPFSMLPSAAPTSAVRVLFNLEQVGDFGTRSDDVIELDDCDNGITRFAEMCGWGEDLKKLVKEVYKNLGHSEKSDTEEDTDETKLSKEEEANKTKFNKEDDKNARETTTDAKSDEPLSAKTSLKIAEKIGELVGPSEKKPEEKEEKEIKELAETLDKL